MYYIKKTKLSDNRNKVNQIQAIERSLTDLEIDNIKKDIMIEKLIERIENLEGEKNV